MEISRSSETLKALADNSRLLILSALKDKPHYVEELSQRLELSPSTISFHLKKLELAGLVVKEKQQYYTVYSLDRDIFDKPLSEFLDFENTARLLQEERVRQYRLKVLNTFIQKGKLLRIPAQYKKRWIVMEQVLNKFQPGRKYREQEVNEIIGSFYHDHCTIRRFFIDERVMERENGLYWLAENYREKIKF